MNLYENHIKRNITIIRQNEKYPILCKSGREKKKHSKEIEKPILPIVRDLYKKGTSKL